MDQRLFPLVRSTRLQGVHAGPRFQSMTYVLQKLFLGRACRQGLFAAAIVLGPALLCWHLHGLWNPDGAYAYGWVVPFLAAFLFKSRWDDRPAPSAPINAAVFFVIAFVVATLPARWLQEAAAERSICSWSYAVACLGLSLSLISLAGGFAWLRWFSFPVLFILTAVPWPHTLETLVSDSLMRGTAQATVEALCLIGIPSALSGNLVHIETGVIDIDEACSGIRSLQAMVMISLFLGELFRLKRTRRLILIGIGIGVTLLTNVVRTATLSTIAFGQSMSAVDRYHDAAGLAVLIVSLSIALFAAFKLRPAGISAPGRDAGGIQPKLPIKLGCAVLVWFLAEEISVEAWYRFHEPKWQGWSWEVEWPRQNDGFHFIQIPPRSLRLLMCDESHAAEWKGPDGSAWALYWIRWNLGNAAAESAKVHRPDVCLNAEGAVMEKDLGAQLVSLGSLKIPFHSYTFRAGEKTLYVAFCLWEEIPDRSGIGADPRFEGTDMIERALKGRRHVGQQSLELAVSGYRSEAGAQEEIKARLSQLLHQRKPDERASRTKITD